jgi:uncharacterized protein YkvS
MAISSLVENISPFGLEFNRVDLRLRLGGRNFPRNENRNELWRHIMRTEVNEVIEFLGIAGNKGFMNDNTVVARRTACNKFFDILEPDQKTVEYVRENLDVIKSRFSNLNKDVRGNTVDEYARRVQVVLDDFSAWKADRSAWERDVSARQNARPAGDGDKKARTAKHDKAKTSEQAGANKADEGIGRGQANPETRVVTFPIRPDFDLTMELPRAGITVDELKRLVYFLLPYAKDWQPTESPRSVFPMLEGEERHVQ